MNTKEYTDKPQKAKKVLLLFIYVMEPSVSGDCFNF